MESWIWNHFTRSDNQVTCNECKKNFNYVSRKGTGNLIAHLKSHKIVAPTNRGSNTEIIIPNVEKTIVSNRDFLEFIIRSGQPFSIVEEFGFQKLLLKIDSTVVIPCRQTIRKELNLLYDSYKNNLINILSNLKNKFSITLDVWKAINGNHYLGINIHYIQNFHLKKITIGFEKLVDQKSTTISSKLIEVLKSFKLNINNFLCYISDNCHTMIASLNEVNEQLKLKIHQFGCMAHKINLIVTGNIINSPTIEDCRKLSKKIRNTSSIKYLLQNINETHKPVTISLDVETRWNSTYIMIRDILKYEYYIKQLVETNNLLTKEQWKEIKKTKETLKPFYKMTKSVSGSKYVTVGSGYYIIRKIKDHLLEIGKILKKKIKLNY